MMSEKVENDGRGSEEENVLVMVFLFAAGAF